MAQQTTNEDAKRKKITGRHLYRKIVRVNIIRWSLLDKVSIFQDFFRFIWYRILSCSFGNPAFRYRRVSLGSSSSSPPPSSAAAEVLESDLQEDPTTSCCGTYYSSSSNNSESDDSDLVNLKISVLGDCQTGKTSFLVKYIGEEQEKKSLQMKGLNLMDKVLIVGGGGGGGGGARIAFKIWDVGGEKRWSMDQVPIACKDAVAILFMFDLTNRTTLNSVIGWYAEARKWNQSAIPILIGTKFDDFAQLPLDIQWTVITQARAYARIMKATLFFSSAKHNINVSKIFKFIMAKLFNLPWNLHRNLTIGEPIIDFF